MKRTLLTLFAAFIATAMALPAQAEITCDAEDPVSSVTVGDATYEITYCGSEVVEGNTTFKWNVEEISGQSLSHITIELCEPLDVLSWTPTADDPLINDVAFGEDPTTGVTGIKWDFADAFTEGMFTITVAGVVGEEEVDVAFKNQTENTGTTFGPNCEGPVCTIETIPSWDGAVNYGASNGDFTPAEISLDTPNGFKSIEIMGGSDNVMLLEVSGESTTGTTAMSNDFGLTGWGTLEFDGATAPTSPTVVFGPQTRDGSTFMFQVTDQDDCTLQVDPQIDMTVPETVELRGNYPNPFNPSTNIEFSLPEAMDVQLDVYDAMGRLVKSLVNDNLEAGVHNVSWNGTDVAGRQVASGAYFYRVQTGSVVNTKQMILLK